MITDRNKRNLNRDVRVLDDSGLPIPTIAWDDPGLEIGYKKNNGDWVTLNLVEGTLKSYDSEGWIEDSEGNGLYQLGIPNDAAQPGGRVVWRYKYATNGYRYDSIDYLAIPSVSSDAVNFNFSIPGSNIIFASQAATIYVKETGLELALTANQDIESVPLVLIMEGSDQTDKYVFYDHQISKSGTDATVQLPESFTDTDQTLSWAIRHASTKRYYGGGSVAVTYAPHEDE